MFIYQSKNCRATPAKQDKLLHCGSCTHRWISNGVCSLQPFCRWHRLVRPFSWHGQNAEQTSSGGYICTSSGLLAAPPAQPPRRPAAPAVTLRVALVKTVYSVLLKIQATETLGKSIREILVHFPLFFPRMDGFQSPNDTCVQCAESTFGCYCNINYKLHTKTR